MANILCSRSIGGCCQPFRRWNLSLLEADMVPIYRSPPPVDLARAPVYRTLQAPLPETPRLSLRSPDLPSRKTPSVFFFKQYGEPPSPPSVDFASAHAPRTSARFRVNRLVQVGTSGGYRRCGNHVTSGE